MLRFKHFINLQEALNDDQKYALGLGRYPTPTPAARELSKNMIPEGDDHVRIPITNSTKEKVQAHLEKHGYNLSDYKNGEAIDKHGRKVSIGSVLKDKKTAAPDDLVRGFENDDRGSKITSESHNILFSANPEHVGECSTNKGWKSCAALTKTGRPTNFGRGLAARRLSDSIKAGSHVAYLMKKDEYDPEKADARILLHPYHTTDENGNITHSVLMPERKVYSKTGGKHSDFHTSLEEYSRKNNPMQEGKIYRKDQTVYDDDQQQIRFNTSPKSVKKILSDKSIGPSAKEEAIKSVKLPHSTISSILNEPKTDENLGHAHRLIAEHQKLSNDHFDKLLGDGHVESLSKNKNLSASQVKKIANHKPEKINTGDHVMDGVVNDVNVNSLSTAHANIINNHHGKLGPNDIHAILDNNAKREEILKKEGKTIDTQYDTPISALVNHLKDKLTPEHIEKIKKSINSHSIRATGENEDQFSYRTRLGINPGDSKESVHKKLSTILNSKPGIRSRVDKILAVKHPQATEEHISKGLDDNEGESYIARTAMENKNATINNISKGLEHPNWDVNLAAAKHPNNNQATIHQALSHKEDSVRSAACAHENATPINIAKGMKDSNKYVAHNAMDNLNANSDNIKAGLKHSDVTMRIKALNHPNATTEHYKMALNDPDPGIKARAQTLLNSGEAKNPYF